MTLATDERVLRRATVMVDHHRSPLSWLRHQSAVRAAGLGADGRTITIHLRDGLTEAILPATPRVAAIRGIASSGASRPETVTRGPANGPPALVLAPFVWQFGSYSTADQVAGLLNGAGFNTTELTNTAVTVDTMKSLANYKVVYITGHAGFLDNGTILIATGQVAPPDGGAYISDINKGSVMMSTIAGGNGSTIFYDVTPAFVAEYMGHFAPNSLVLANGCGTTYSSTFAQAFQAAGVDTYIGWNNEVVQSDMERGGYAVMQNLAQGGMTAQQAVGSAVQSGAAASDPPQMQPSQMTLSGDGNLTFNLVQATPTSIPTLTPTSTPVPVATQAPIRSPSKSRLSLAWHHLRVRVGPSRIPAESMTIVKVRAQAPHMRVRHALVTLNGRTVKAGFHRRYTNGSGIAVFHERPRKAGIIHGWIDRPHMKPLKFSVRVVK